MSGRARNGSGRCRTGEEVACAQRRWTDICPAAPIAILLLGPGPAAKPFRLECRECHLQPPSSWRRTFISLTIEWRFPKLHIWTCILGERCAGKRR